MALLKIYIYPDPILRQRVTPVVNFDQSLKDLSRDMIETLYDAPGVGLAANQVGVLQDIFVLDVDYSIEGDEETGRKYLNQNPRIFINAKLMSTSEEIFFKEGCLSVPGFSAEVKRWKKAELQYQDLFGKQQTLLAEGLLSVAIQHELDHLQGRLYIDRLSEVKRSIIKNKMKKEQHQKFEKSRFHVEL